jgi:hypothetical protein
MFSEYGIMRCTITYFPSFVGYFASLAVCHIIQNISLTFWHRSFTFNSNKSPTCCNRFSVYYPDVCLQLNMFLAFSPHDQELNDCSGSLWFYLRIVVIVVLCSWSGRLLMLGGKTPETCWTVNKRQDNKLKNCCIRLVIYLNCTIMHGLTNLKYYI